MRFAVGNNCGNGTLAARSRRGRHSEKRRKFFVNFKQTLHLIYGFFRTYRSCADRFGAVHSRTASKRQNTVALVLPENKQTLFDLFYGRIRHNSVENGVLQFIFGVIEKGFESIALQRGFIANDERTANVIFQHKIDGFFETSRPLQKFRLMPRHESHTYIQRALVQSAVNFSKYVHSTSLLTKNNIVVHYTTICCLCKSTFKY